MHADDVEEGLAIDIEAGAGAAFDVGLLGEWGGCAEGLAGFGYAGRLPVGIAAEDGGEGTGEVASGIGVVGKTEGHEEGTEVGVTEAEGTIVMGVLGDHLGGVTGRVHDDFHRSSEDGDSVAVAVDIELATGGEELEQVEAGEVAGGVVEEHVLRARIGGVDAGGVLGGVPAVDRSVVLHSWIAALPGGFGDLVHEVAGAVFLDGQSAFDGAGGEGAIILNGLHELVGDADGVVCVLEEDGAVCLRVGAGAIVAGLNEVPGFLLFLDLALDKVFDIRVIDVEDYHLGRAAGFAAGLDDSGEGVESAHEGEWAGGCSAAAEGLHGAADVGEVGTCAGAPLEEHAFGLGKGKDGVEGVLDGVDEAGGALGLGVAGDGELNLSGGSVPVPVLGVGVGLEAIAAYVEPDGRVEGDLLMKEEVGEFGVESGGILGRGEVSVADAPIADGLCDTGDESADTRLALGGAIEAVEVLGRDDVGGSHGPVGRDLDVFLLEDGLALVVLNDGVAEFPDDFVVGRDTGAGEVTGEGEAGGVGGWEGCLRVLGGARAGGLVGDGCHGEMLLLESA